MESVLFDLARSDHRYAYEAYEFVCETVTYTQERLGKLETADVDGEAELDRHVCGEELLRGGCELAVREFGLMAPLVFRRWGLNTTDDFGEIVFRLIRAERLSQSEQDDPADFHEVFDLMAALGESYDFDTSAYAAEGGAMSFARIRLIAAALLFLGWLGWLGYAVSRKGTVQIVSRAQLAAATHWVIVEVALGPDGMPLPKATVKETLRGEAIKGEIEVRNLPASATPLPVAGESRTPPAGLYLLPLVKVADGLYRIAGLPRSPGFEPQTPERPLIYPWNDDVKKQIESK